MATAMKEELTLKKPFRSRTDGQLKKTTEAGSKLATLYEIEIDEHGHKSIIATGTKNIYAEIQSYLEETKIENILAKALLGDTEALTRVEAKYMDTTEMPKTLAEAQNMIIKLKSEFDSLPLDVRREFNFSPEEYIASYGSEAWATTMGFIKEEPTASINVEEEKADE